MEKKKMSYVDYAVNQRLCLSKRNCLSLSERYRSRDIKHKIISLCKDSDISFLQTIILKDHQNEIKFLPIEYFGSVDQFLSMLPQLFTADSTEALYKDCIPVNSLNEIPYYHLQQGDYDEYYRKQKAKKKIRGTENNI